MSSHSVLNRRPRHQCSLQKGHSVTMEPGNNNNKNNNTSTTTTTNNNNNNNCLLNTSAGLLSCSNTLFAIKNKQERS